MKWYHTIPLLLALTILSGCQRIDEEEEAIQSTFVASYEQAQPVSLEELAAAPAAYLDEAIQLTGQFNPAPELVCIGSKARKSPASWSLTGGGWVAQAGGMYENVVDIISPGLEMTVEGVWRLWSGPVGCGKEARTTEVWYLGVEEILAPRPIVRMTLTPSAVVVESSEATSATEGTEVAAALSPTPSATLAGDGATPSGLPAVGPPTETPSPVPVATVFPSATFTATVTAEPGAESTASPSPEATAGSAEPTATSTPTGTRPTETPTVTSTATPSGPLVVDMGGVGFHSLVLERLDSNTRHEYSFSVAAGTAITIGLVMPLDFNPGIIVLDPNGNKIVDQDLVGAGEVERVENLLLSSGGEYRLNVREGQERAVDYSFTMNDGQPTDFLYFAGLLSYGDTKHTLMPPLRVDFWHFWGEAGDEVTISLNPNDQSDLRFLLSTPQFVDYPYVDERPGGQPEQEMYILPDTGLYTIQVEEYDFDPSDYLITLTGPSEN